MRIDLNRSIPGAQGSEESSRASARPASTGKGIEPAADAAEVSWGRASVQALTASVHQLPEIRQERVAALSQMIRSDTYRVTPEQMADALITHMSRASGG